MQDILQQTAELRKTIPSLHLYALVDGLQYQTHTDKPLKAAPGLSALFAGTPDAALAQYGPWLIEVEQANPAYSLELAVLEKNAPSVVWLIAIQDLQGLTQVLQRNLDVQLPDGRKALLRFWDPRVLVNLARTLDVQQRQELLAPVHEWHFMYEGRRVWIGRPRDNA